MEITFNLITFIDLAATVLGILSAIVIFYFGFKNNRANLPLAIGQLSISLGIFVSFSQVSKLILYWPFMYRLGHLAALIFIPMPYLHMVFYTKNRFWKWYDLLHAIPLLLFLVDYWHVLTLTNAEKLLILKREVNDLNLLGQFTLSKYIGPRFHQEFRTVLLSAYWVAQVVVLRKWLKSERFLTPQNKVWKNWMQLFMVCQFFMWFPFYLSLFGLEIMTTYHIVNSFSVGWLMISSLSLFFFPSLLYGKASDISPMTLRKAKINPKSPPTEEEEKKLEEMMQVIATQMEDRKLFLKTGYSINDFSNDIQLPVYQISKILNRFKGLSFVDYINYQRIQYCIDQFEKGEWQNFTLEAVAMECGFSNRNTFTKSFKKIKNCSPSDFRDALKLKNESSNIE